MVHISYYLLQITQELFSLLLLVGSVIWQLAFEISWVIKTTFNFNGIFP